MAKVHKPMNKIAYIMECVKFKRSNTFSMTLLGCVIFLPKETNLFKIHNLHNYKTFYDIINPTFHHNGDGG